MAADETVPRDLLSGAKAPAGESLCGVWVARTGAVHTCVAGADGSRENRQEALTPFAWIGGMPDGGALPGITVERLAGEGPFSLLLQADALENYQAFLE